MTTSSRAHTPQRPTDHSTDRPSHIRADGLHRERSLAFWQDGSPAPGVLRAVASPPDLSSLLLRQLQQLCPGLLTIVPQRIGTGLITALPSCDRGSVAITVTTNFPLKSSYIALIEQYCDERLLESLVSQIVARVLVLRLVTT